MRPLIADVTADAGGSGSVTLHDLDALIMNIYAVPGSGMTGNVDATMVAPPVSGVAPRTLLTITNLGTSPVDIPLRIQAKDATNTAISGVYVHAPVCGDLTVNITGGTSGKKVTFYIIVLDSDSKDGRRGS